MMYNKNVGAIPCGCPLNGDDVGYQKGTHEGHPYGLIWKIFKMCVGAIPCGCPWSGDYVGCQKGTHKGHPYGANHV